MIKKYIHYSILSLVLLGWFLNFKYYFSRFVSEGFEDWLAYIISISLVIFASFCFGSSQYLEKKEKKLWVWICKIIYFLLALYSINCTTAGQYWDQQEIDKENTIKLIDNENNSYWIDRYKEKIAESEKEIDRLNEIRNKSIHNLGNMYYYKNTEKTINQRIEEENEKISKNEAALKKHTNKNVVSAKTENNIEMSKQIYEFYYSKDPELIQFFFQVLLSIFIEAIAQVSIYVFMQINTKSYRLTKDKLNAFCAYAWYAIDIEKQDILTDKATALKLAKDYNNFNGADYDYIIGLGYKAGMLIKQNGYIKPESGITSNIFYNRLLNLTEVNERN